MKRQLAICFLLVFILVSCTPNDNGDLVETRFIASPTTIVSPKLSTLDSLMWHQPDSALMRLLPYFDTCCRDAKFCVSNATEYNRHYANLLLAELLYKNDYAQANRKELKEAVHYFDSLLLADTRGMDTPHASATTPQTHAFLDARAHYINGVGYYETDSVVPACAEYLKALEVMEDNFEEKDLVGKNAKFMTYIYNRLGELFSGQYMMESAIESFTKSYELSLVEPISAYSLSSLLHHIGMQYNKVNKKDSAYCYYERAIKSLPDTTNLFYRDLKSSQALLSYQLEKNAEPSLQLLHRMMQLADDKEERLTRCFTIGDIFFEDNLFDSALLYLEPVFRNTTDAVMRIQSADYLRIIYDSMGMSEKSDEYIRFLAINKKSSGQNKAEVSQLNAQYKAFKDEKLKCQSANEKSEVRKKTMSRTIGFVVPIALVTTLIIIFMIRKKHRKILSEKEAEEKRLQNANAYLKTKLVQQSKAQNAKPHKAPVSAYEALMKETVCLHLVQRIRSVEIITTNKPSIYVEYAASTKEKRELVCAVEKHCPDFGPLLKAQCPSFTRNDFELCRYLLIGIMEPQVAVLLQKDYSTVWKRAKEIKEALQTEEPEHRLKHILFEDF